MKIFEASATELRASPEHRCVISFRCTNEAGDDEGRPAKVQTCGKTSWVSVQRPAQLIEGVETECAHCGIRAHVKARP